MDYLWVLAGGGLAVAAVAAWLSWRRPMEQTGRPHVPPRPLPAPAPPDMRPDPEPRFYRLQDGREVMYLSLGPGDWQPEPGASPVAGTWTGDKPREFVAYEGSLPPLPPVDIKKSVYLVDDDKA